MTSLGIHGYTILKDALEDADLKYIKEELLVKPFNMMDMGASNQDLSFAVYRESPARIKVPKYYGLKHFGVPDESDLECHVQKIHLEFKGTLRPEQEAPVRTFLEATQDKAKRGGIISLQCAAGKTVMALNIITKLNVKTLVVVHKEFLLNQWQERISQFIPGARVGFIKGAVCDVQDKDIVIGSLQSLSMKTYDPSVFRDFGFSIYDEVHHCAAQVFSRVFYKVTTMYSLGLSATVSRKDGLTKVFKWHIGDIVFQNKKKANDVMRIIMKDYFDSSAEYCAQPTMANRKPNISKMINNICDFMPRIHFIISCLQDVLEEEPDRKVLLLSDRRKHLEHFHEELDKVGITSGYYYGGLKQEVLEQSEKQQVLLGTYAYVSEGFDMKGLNTLILASPKSDIVQSVGRILRDKIEDRKYEALVIDIVDKFSIFPNQAQKRIKYYQSQKYKIDRDTIEYRIDENAFKGKCLITCHDDCTDPERH